MQNRKKIGIVGAGASGLMACISALRSGADVVLFDHKGKPGRKLLITGKGRCNVTNHCSPAEVLESVLTNPKFLMSAVNAFSPADVIRMIEDAGTPLKTERGQRVFPVSDRSSDILNALLSLAETPVILNRHVTAVSVHNGRADGIVADKETYPFDAVILATGGLSYSATGADGSGYGIAAALGHTIISPVPALVPLESSSSDCSSMQGLSLKNVSVTVCAPDGSELYEDFGEMLFTHFGVSGPMILSASSAIRATDLNGYTLFIDLKPALTEKETDERILSDFSKNINRDYTNALGALLPQKMIPVVIRRSGIDPRKKVNSITKEERKALVRTIKHFEIPLTCRRPIEEAIITRGGISVKEIHPKTMESRLIPGLFFAGEMIDVDAYTGGFNLQISFSTGFAAGKYAATEETFLA